MKWKSDMKIRTIPRSSKSKTYARNQRVIGAYVSIALGLHSIRRVCKTSNYKGSVHGSIIYYAESLWFSAIINYKWLLKDVTFPR